MGPAILGIIPRFQRCDRSRAAALRRGPLSAISVAELAHGIHRANTPERRQARRAFLDDLKETVPVYPITSQTGELVGMINAESSKKGVIIPFDDLLIGACALERGYTIATINVQIPGLTILSI